MSEENENKYDEVQTPMPSEGPTNPMGEATDPAAAAGQVASEPAPTESSDPDPEQAAEPVDASPEPTPEQEATEHAEGGSEDSSSDES